MPLDVRCWPIANKLLCFNVESRSKPQFPREVDLESFKFNGECDCERFEFKCHPMLSRGADPAEHLRCSHIKAARSYFLDEILPKIFPLIRPIVEHQTTPAQQAEGLVSAIVSADPNTYQPKDKLADLMALKTHVDASIEQIMEEIDNDRDPAKHEDEPVMPGHPDDTQY